MLCKQKRVACRDPYGDMLTETLLRLLQLAPSRHPLSLEDGLSDADLPPCLDVIHTFRVVHIAQVGRARPAVQLASVGFRQQWKHVHGCGQSNAQAEMQTARIAVIGNLSGSSC